MGQSLRNGTVKKSGPVGRSWTRKKEGRNRRIKMTSPPTQNSAFEALDALAFAHSQQLSSIANFSFYELQERADFGEISLSELAKGCWDELHVYRNLLDEIYALKFDGQQWKEHHDAIERLLSLIWHAREASRLQAHDVRAFQRVLSELDKYHDQWRVARWFPIVESLEEAAKENEAFRHSDIWQQAKPLLGQAEAIYRRFTMLKDIGDGLVEDFFDEGSCALKQCARLEREKTDLEETLQRERQKQRAQNPFNLPLGVQDFPLKAIEAAARQNGFEITRRQIQKHLSNWRGADREKGEKWLLSRAELEEFLRYLSQRQRAKP